MRVGLRLQLLCLLGVLLLLSFVPLYYATSTYTRATLQAVRAEQARALGRTVLAHILDAREHRPPEKLQEVLTAATGGDGPRALALFDAKGDRVVQSGSERLLSKMRHRYRAELSEGRELAEHWQDAESSGLVLIVPSQLGSAMAVIATDASTARATPLVGLLGLYTGLMALTLLVMSYFALTRWIVRPLDALSRTVGHIADGGRDVVIPKLSSQELHLLGERLDHLAKRLRQHEEELTGKVAEAERAKEHLNKTQGQLIAAERMASVGRLSAGLAHELGNPLAALIGMQDLLLVGGLNETERRDFLERMQRETDRINTILRDLLQFARPEKGKVGDEAASPGNVEAAINDTATLLTPQKRMHHMQVRLDVFPDLPPVRMATEQLVQVLLNLSLNAGDACSGSGQVTLRATRADGGVQVEIVDDGPGVPAELADQVFEPFFTSKEVGQGTGLGLSVCRGLVETVGGLLSLDAAHEGGARFVIWLPAADAPSAAPPA